MKSGQGSLRWKRTRVGSTACTSRTRSLKSGAAAPRYRSKENFTSSAVTGSPLWNLTPLRNTKSHVRPSFDMLHDSARHGVLIPAGIGLTSASCSAYMTMNGVISASVSPGSSHRDASVTCAAHVIVPVGSAAAGTANRSASTGSSASVRTNRLMSVSFRGQRGGRRESSRAPSTGQRIARAYNEPMPAFLPFVRRWFDATFTEATRPQREGWDAIASGRDTLIVAPTGSGKTLAAFLWTLDHLHRLAAEGRLRLPEVRVAVRTGAPLAAARQAMTRRPPHILITTPESLFILLTAERFRPALAQTRFVIVDEIHALMGSKRGAHLALSLERLQALVEAHEPGARPQRIGCSATVSPVDDALAFLTGTTARDPAVVDAGFARQLDVRVVTPVDDFLTAQSDTIWEAALQQIAELVAAHRTTLVFAQSRRSAERLARDLNDPVGEGLVAAHHGSLSRRARLEAENRLEDGTLRALVATSSLELGIDVGAIDLVVQVQSPRTVAAALQRVGRSGHLLSRVSKGRIVVTKGDELVEAAAVVRSIRAHALDRVTTPDAPLDVLAQQIVAAVAAESLSVDELHARFTRAAPYRALTREAFVNVVGMLAEPLPAELKGAAPRILWDRVNDRLHARRGSRFLAVTSGGTIPDAGLFDVFVADTDLRVGTLDEEFVTESLPGDVFLLGSNAWRIVKVRSDRVLVEDAHGMSPTIPFWRGEHPSRSWELGVAVGRLRRDASDRLDQPDFMDWAREECGLEPAAAGALRAWLVQAGGMVRRGPRH